MSKSRSRWFWFLGLLLAIAAPTREAASVDLLVSDPASGQIAQIDGVTGLPEGIFALAGADELVHAAGLRLGPDGRLYVGSSGSVFRFDAPTGAFIDKLDTGLTGTTGYFLALAADGTLFSNAFYGSQVVRFDGATGARSYIGGPPLVPTGLDIGPDGNLYVGDFAGNRVVRFHATTGAFLGVFATIPILGPAGAAGATRFGPDGRLYVALFNSGDVVRFDGATGAYLGPFIPAGDPHPTSPSHLDWGPDGNLYVASSGSGEVLRYHGTTGAFLGVFASGLGSLWGLEFVPDLAPPYTLLPPVDTTSGPVRGFLAEDVRRYLGVPYAEAPAGTRRWKRPEREGESQTDLIAITPGPVCPQLAGTSAVGDEDCLKLSIWRPHNPPATPLPVLFYLHGGTLSIGSNSSARTDGSDLADSQNLIVVEPQYRLGALGFFGLPELASEDPNGSTGNYGLLDQLEALRWVRDNIAAFGGDPNQVTIAGQSAGGSSVCALMTTPLSDGLFRAGIIQSGPQCNPARPLSLPAQSPLHADPFFGPPIYERSGAVAAGAGCPAGPGQLACLRALPASSLVQALGEQPRALDGNSAANPAIDNYVLSEQPLVLLRQGAADNRPVLIGSVANESTYFTDGLELEIPTPELYDLLVREKLGNTRADALLPLYPAASYVSPAEAFRTLLDDAGWACPSLVTADATTAGGSPAWVYHLTFPPTYAPTSTFAGRRTFHELDLYYIFGTYPRLGIDYGIVTDTDDDVLSESMQEAWGSFVKTGVPSTAPPWPVYAPTTPGDLASVSVMLFDSLNSTVPGHLFRSSRCAALQPVVNFLDVDRDVATYDEDNCPVTANTTQTDAELDTVGDACDNCPLVSNVSQTNSDSDTLGDACDNCATVANGPAEAAVIGVGNQTNGTVAWTVGQALESASPGGVDNVGDACDNCLTRNNPRKISTYLASNPWATLSGGQRDDDHDGYGNQCDAKFPGVAGTNVSLNDRVQINASLGESRLVDTCGTTNTRPCAIFDLDDTGTNVALQDVTRFNQLLGSPRGPRCPTHCTGLLTGPLPCTAGTAGTCGTIP